MQTAILTEFGLYAKLDNALADRAAISYVSEAIWRWAPDSALCAVLSVMVMVCGVRYHSSNAMGSFCAYCGMGILLGWLIQVSISDFCVVGVLYLQCVSLSRVAYEPLRQRICSDGRLGIPHTLNYTGGK